MLKVFQSNELWKIATWETPDRTETFEYLSKMHEQGKWDEIQPAWVEPNYLLNGLLNISLWEMPFVDRFKPYVLYGGHHRLEYAKQHNLPFKAYVRFTPGNPPIPEREKRCMSIDG